ncbi:MAG: bifunctional (p)ppGpp synthetase/guanosine-3',5'-bis(diphosphate) 3'-pyrophosphohydrolase, partial [Peptococcaceae bacterium]|nr:bifunctional (p)ppGpp synthetase/guanosine-3',5'-bis(diphosphate) 3'-pyrophosphohydrolase [Peptococcaceae bacterium]
MDARSNQLLSKEETGEKGLYLDELIQWLRQCHSKADTAVISDAYLYAEDAHRKQTRKSGDPYIIHPTEVTKILAELDVDQETLIAALLHDVVEDTGITLDMIRERFGSDIALMVDGVTKLKSIKYLSKEEHQAENLRKMFLAMAKDIRVLLIKLADRLHNMRTLKYHPRSKEIALETMEIYAPLANRLGIYRMKWELEDLSFKYQQPEQFNQLLGRIKQSRDKREEYINTVSAFLQEKLAAMGIEAELNGRPKHLYSINNKMIKQNKNLDEIYDVMAIRCLVKTLRDCYASLGVVHTLWKPIPGRFKDFIAMPKTNMYQSLHTTVVGPNGGPLEIQMRTYEMHRIAEYGIAAHWRYKEGGRGDQDFERKLAWLRQVLEWESDMRDPREFMEGLKIEIFSDTVFVFSPRGDVLELPAGSMPLDFAYRIHTAVGHNCIGAKINGHIVPLDYKLKNGDIVEIMTTKNSTPKWDWLNITKTSQAKTKIRQWFKKERREESLQKGKEVLERELKKQGLELDHSRSEKLLEHVKRFSITAMDDLYVAISDGVLNAANIVGRIKSEEIKPERILSLEEEAHALNAD